jgi:SAM-dependent methyltransferase
MTRPCLVCGGAYGPAHIPGLLECTACKFVTADTSLSFGELERLYSEKYFQGEEYRDYVSERHLFERQFRRRLNTLLRYLPATNRHRLFEIGAAYGFFLGLADSYFDEVSGIDISQDASAYARDTVGVNVATGDFAAYEVKSPVDAICLWDTVEHLQHPDLYIEKAASHLAPGGVIALTTGDIGSLLARLQKEKWRQIHPPTHLHYFSKDTLGRLLSKYGLEVCYAGYDGCYRSVDTVAYILLSLKRGRPDLYQKLKATGLIGWSFYSNFYDIVYMIVRKKA